jgi:hypothetical protein
MLEGHEFCDHCPGCRPAVFDPTTGKVYAPDSQVMQIINLVWDTETSYAERKAFIEVTLHNSKAADDMRLAKALLVKFSALASFHG